MTFPTNKLQATSNKLRASQSGVTLLLAILILSAIMAISFSIATILFIEIRTSSDLLRTEPALYAAEAVTEEALFKFKRELPTCPTRAPNCFTAYPTSIGNVRLDQPSVPTESSTSNPIFQIKVSKTSNSFTNTSYRYPLFDPQNPTGGSNFGRVKLTYLQTGNSAPLTVYICQFDPTSTYGSPVCSNPSGSELYWLLNNSSLTAGSLITQDLNPILQQELIFVNSTGQDVYVQVETFGTGPGYAPKGIPYIGETAVDISAGNGPVTRKVRVKIPNTSSGGNSGGGSPTNVASLSSDGVGDYAIVGNQASLRLSNFTVEAWIYPRSTDANYQPIVGKQAANGTNRNYALFINLGGTTRIHFSMMSPCGIWRSYNSNGTVNLNQWNHVATTYDGANFILYINGVLDNSIPLAVTPCQTADPVKIGGEIAAASMSSLDGLIDEVRIWNVARDLATINAQRNSELVGTEPGLVGYWKFNENSGSSAANSVSGGNPATFQFDTAWSTNVPF
jgi:Tfp pilus assembly protein PilX